MLTRPDWNTYFMKFAEAAATRGTCDRKQVGAVIVVNKQVVATGYNGSVAGMAHCSTGPHEVKKDPENRGWYYCIHCKEASMNESSPSGECPENLGADHDMDHGHCVRTIHAEMNALAQAAKRGVIVDGSTIYTTASPCWDCFRVAVNAGIKHFIFKEAYRTDENAERIKAVVAATGVVVEQLKQT